MQEFKEHEIEWTDEKVSKLWDYYSRTYPYNQSYFTKSVGKDILRRTEKIIGKLDEKITLDFGCGPAFFIDHMNDLNIHPKKYIGLDFSKDSVENISNKSTSDFEKIGILAQKLPTELGNDSIDICFLIEVIEHLNDEYLDKTLKEIYRVLKPEGKLIITTPNNEDLDFAKNFCPDCGCIYHKWQHVRKLDSKELKKILLNYKFKIEVLSPLKFKNENFNFVSSLKYGIKEILGKNNVNLFGIFSK